MYTEINVYGVPVHIVRTCARAFFSQNGTHKDGACLDPFSEVRQVAAVQNKDCALEHQQKRRYDRRRLCTVIAVVHTPMCLLLIENAGVRSATWATQDATAPSTQSTVHDV